MLMCVFVHSRSVENPLIGSWETNPCFLGAGVFFHIRVIRLLVRHTLYIMGYINCIQNGSHDYHGVCQSSGFEGKTH
jgi:hypothetical protein